MLDGAVYKDLIKSYYVWDPKNAICVLYDHWYDKTTINGQGIIGDQLISIPHLCTGVSGTAQFNSFKMCGAIEYFLRDLGKSDMDII